LVEFLLYVISTSIFSFYLSAFFSEALPFSERTFGIIESGFCRPDALFVEITDYHAVYHLNG